MMNDIYHRLPVALQNVACSGYGLKLRWERYSPPWGACYGRLQQTQWLSGKDIAILQDRLLRRILRQAVTNVPFYSDDRYAGKIVPFYGSAHALLAELPVLDRQVFREHAEDFVSDRYPRQRLVKLHTSGTTGAPITIYIHPRARKWNYAFFERSKLWAGINGFEPSITFAGRPIVPPGQKDPPFWRKNRTCNNTLFSSYHLSERNLPAYIEEMRKINPVFIDSYPSSISPLADYCLAHGIDDLRPRAIITSSETLLEYQRANIESAFGCRVFDQYGCVEQSVYVCQCEQGNYHVNPEYGLLEVLDANDRPVRPGEPGHFVCTGFTNAAMPLVRYRIGDMGILSDEQCACGRSFPVVAKISGRRDDFLVSLDGKYVGRVSPVFTHGPQTIREAQVIQEKKDQIRIKIVKNSEYLEEHGKYVINELDKILGPGMQYDLVYVTEIPRSSNGKFRAVINRVPEYASAVQ